MTTPVVDPTFQPACYVFGFTLPGMGCFGNTRWYPQQAIFGTRAFGYEIPGKNTESDVFAFRYGAYNPKTPHRKAGAWVTSASPWPATSDVGCRVTGVWAKRIIFYTRRGYQVARRYTPYDSMAKECLVPSMLKLMESSFLYSILTDENKARLTADAKRTRQATQGHNYFTKLYIQDDPRWQDYV
jgi:hypothetical protein